MVIPLTRYETAVLRNIRQSAYIFLTLYAMGRYAALCQPFVYRILSRCVKGIVIIPYFHTHYIIDSLFFQEERPTFIILSPIQHTSQPAVERVRIYVAFAWCEPQIDVVR